MANERHLEQLLRQSAAEWNHWRRETGVRPDLSFAVLSDPNPDWAIRGSVESNLEGYDLSLADLRGATLTHARLRGAMLRAANLRLANLRFADLREANLSEARLHQANLTLANCQGAVFSGALFWETILARTNLREAKGLEEVKHGGPSIIDHRTLKKSGTLPDRFLRGIGLPLDIAAGIAAHAKENPEFASCFISYSSRDSEFATALTIALEKRGVECWLAEHDMRGGLRVVPQIEGAIDDHDRVLLILSDSSMRSPWVGLEIRRARDRERSTGSDVLFPIALIEFASIKRWQAVDPDTGEDLARSIREYHVQDFSAWGDEQVFRRAVERLVGDLRKPPNRPGQRPASGRR